jgi:hypothetical protein
MRSQKLASNGYEGAPIVKGSETKGLQLQAFHR